MKVVSFCAADGSISSSEHIGPQIQLATVCSKVKPEGFVFGVLPRVLQNLSLAGERASLSDAWFTEQNEAWRGVELIKGYEVRVRGP